MKFMVRGITPKGEAATQLIDALSAADAQAQATAQGWMVVDVVLRRGTRGRREFSQLLFTQELLALLEAGLSVVEAIDTLAEKENRPESRQVLERILTGLRDGRPLSQALEISGEFPALYVATVRAAEKTSNLPDALSRYLQYQGQIEAMKKQLVNAAIYPILLLGVGGLVTLFLLMYVVPRLAGIYDDMTNLPWAARALMQWGLVMRDHASVVLIALAAIIAVIIWLATRPSFHRFMAQQLWNISWLRSQWRIFTLARFYRASGLLLHGGIPAVTAMEMCSDLLHPALRPGLVIAIKAVAEGKPMSQSLADQDLTTPVAVRLLRVGERSGRLGDMLERIARFYDDDIDRWINWLTRLISPLLMLVIGVVIGGIVFLLYLPIFELVGNLH